jgi:hypothetical protein
MVFQIAVSQTKYILHAVEATILLRYPVAGANGAIGESHSTRCFMGDFNAFAFGSE